MVQNNTARKHPSVAIVGAGRVGSTLARALHAAHYPIVAVWSRTAAHSTELANAVDASVVPIAQIADGADLILLAVPDDQLKSFAHELVSEGAALAGRMVVHLSGVSPAAVLDAVAHAGAMTGGLHLLAAIARRDQLLPTGITFAVEAREPLRTLLWQIAVDLGGDPFDLQPADRPLYHAAAVLTANYTVVLAALASALAERAGAGNGNGLRAILPLLDSTLANLHQVGLPDALTGPLVRGDVGTVVQHLRALDQAAPATADAYRSLGQ